VGPRVLSGITVLDVGTWIAGPAAATVMSDFGAQVIKVEPPGGDPYRGLMDLPGMPASDLNYAWLLDARNKKSVVLNLAVPEAQEALRTLAARVDVFLTNQPPERLARLGLGYEALAALNPRLVYASLTGYGHVGEEANRPGFDINAWWARSGLMDIVRPAGGPPTSSVPGMGDHPTAMALFGAIMLALYRRERTGRGGPVNTSLIANGVWANSVLVQAMLCGATFLERQPRHRAPNPLSNLYRCRDGRWFVLTLLREDREWAPFARALGRPDLLADPRFATGQARRTNSVALIETLDAVFAGRDWADWERLLDAEGITCAAMARLDEVRDDRQLAETGTFARLEVKGRPALRTVMSPIDVGDEPKAEPRRAPELGEHTEEVLRGAGYDASAIERLRALGALG
jgi:formyl-CoA transferase